MSLKCPKCDTENVDSKQITSAKGTFTIYECQAGCEGKENPKGGHYKFSFFPPKKGSANQDILDKLEIIDKKLDRIESKL